MHYRHHYHAGNFADVFKHALLIELLRALSRKASPWCYVDTHAGAGRYGLGERAERTGEWAAGVGRLREATNLSPALEALRERLGGTVALAAYPGSPWIAAGLARSGDRLILCETVPEVADELRQEMRNAPQAAGVTIALHRRDGYEALPALTPPPEKRGLVLIDPPFERSDEFEAMEAAILASQARWSGGVYAAWYPVKQRYPADRFRRRLQRALPGVPLLDARLDTGAPSEGQMHACGLLVLNPPWQFDQAAGPLLTELARLLACSPRAEASLDWITPAR
ncbi:MAG TPA: 23S rRNA (adenine(2030)-N(6))-methyltransferase RlmJ [Nevskiaceae bacterium]|nr:23S rRNA (adenine(2030)-N(6))-methyltransferase RlmJ [Nevskiaceae bacterium]